MLILISLRFLFQMLSTLNALLEPIYIVLVSHKPVNVDLIY